MINPAAYDHTAQAPAQSASSETASMGKDDFLKLLVAQLQHQDPLNPSDPTEFTAQLSQFSSLEQLFEVNKQLGAMVDKELQSQPLQSLSMLGKDVVADIGPEFSFNNKPVEVGGNFEIEASSASVNIFDKNSLLVTSIPMGELNTGNQFVTWDGLDANGRAVPAGEYSFIINAQSTSGEDIVVDRRVKARIEGVDLNATDNSLKTNAGSISMSAINHVLSGS